MVEILSDYDVQITSVNFGIGSNCVICFKGSILHNRYVVIYVARMKKCSLMSTLLVLGTFSYILTIGDDHKSSN